MDSQSSSTLNNYVPQQSQNPDSSCSQCQNIHIREEKSSSSSHSSSSHDDGQLIAPLHKHIVTHSRQLQKTMELLQLQIQKLKHSNIAKDKMIDQLKIQIKQYSAMRLQDNIRRQSKQINNLRQQLSAKGSESSKSISNHNQKHRANKKNIQVIYQEKYTPSSKHNEFYPQEVKMSKERIKQSDDEDSLLENYKKPKTQKAISKQTQKILKNAYKNQSKQQYKLFSDKQTNYKQCIQRLQKHIKICEEQMVWMTNFILGFLRMGQKLSFLFNQKIVYNNWSLRKKTKTVWRYIKHILYYLTEIEQQN